MQQAAAVQNTWYTALTTQTRNTRVYFVTIVIGTADESLDLRIIADGVTMTGSINATFGTVYSAYPNYGLATDSLSLVAGGRDVTYIVEGANVSVLARKTTNAGAGTLSVKVMYGLRY